MKKGITPEVLENQLVSELARRDYSTLSDTAAMAKTLLMRLLADKTQYSAKDYFLNLCRVWWVSDLPFGYEGCASDGLRYSVSLRIAKLKELVGILPKNWETLLFAPLNLLVDADVFERFKIENPEQFDAKTDTVKGILWSHFIIKKIDSENAPDFELRSDWRASNNAFKFLPEIKLSDNPYSIPVYGWTCRGSEINRSGLGAEFRYSYPCFQFYVNIHRASLSQSSKKIYKVKRASVSYQVFDVLADNEAEANDIIRNHDFGTLRYPVSPTENLAVFSESWVNSTPYKLAFDNPDAKIFDF